MHAFILAGGFATRLWPLTERRAKPLLPLAGKPLLSYILEAIPEGMPVTVSTNAVFADDMRAWAATMNSRKINVLIEDAGHEGEKLGALGAVAKWITEQKIDDDILLLAGDNYADFKLKDLIDAFHGQPIVAGYNIGDIDSAKRFGTIVLKEGEGALRTVQSFQEKPLQPLSTVVSTGWSVIPRSALPVLTTYAKTHPDDIGGIFEEFLHQNINTNCFLFTGLWKDIGSFEAYLELHRDIVGQTALVAKDTTIDAETKLMGSNDIGPKTRITKSQLRDCIVFGESTITDCVLERCIIDSGCILDGIDLTDKMLRAGTILRR